MILSINIYEEDNQKSGKSVFFKKIGKKGLKELNTDFWNNDRIVGITGYSVLDLKICLYDLAEFIASNLSPNRLSDFDIEAIKTIEPYNDIPVNIGLNLQNL